MLIINYEEYYLLLNEIKFINAKYNHLIGYSPLIQIEFMHNDTKGYITFYLGFYDTIDFNFLRNKRFKVNPSDIGAMINCVEIFDTNKFIDNIDSEMEISFGNIVDHKIEMKLIIDDNEIQLKYEGYLNIIL